MGDYRDKSGSERVDAPEKIDLTNVMLDVYHGVKRLWWLFIGLIIICAVQSYFSVSTSYQSKYVASATVSVTSVGGMDYVDAQSAQQMAEVFPYILTSGVLKDVVAEDMGLDSMPGSIDVKADDGTLAGTREAISVKSEVDYSKAGVYPVEYSYTAEGAPTAVTKLFVVVQDQEVTQDGK